MAPHETSQECTPQPKVGKGGDSRDLSRVARGNYQRGGCRGKGNTSRGDGGKREGICPRAEGFREDLRIRLLHIYGRDAGATRNGDAVGIEKSHENKM